MAIKSKEALTEVLQISDVKDFSVNIRATKPKKIPTKTVSLYLEDMEIKDTINQPFLFIILPFFTSKRQRNVNLVYEIANAGIKFGASLSTDDFEGIKNQQPSDFEKNVFYFVLYKFQELLMEKETEGKNYIVFNIEEVIDYLGLKFSMKYYRKMEETLYNLQATTYKIVIRNRKKAGNIIREVYKEPLNLIKYEKIKERNTETNKMKVYYRVKLDERIIEELKRKHYSIFDRHLLNDLRKADRASEKIYQYISMKRFSDDAGEQRIETLATIVPLTTTSRIKKKLKNGKVKEYEVSKMKQVLRRIKKCFDVLVSKGYLLDYRVEEMKDIKSYKFVYSFNPEKDNNCHISSLVESKSIKQIAANAEKPTAAKPAAKGVIGITDDIRKEIQRAKKNIFVSKAWNKRVDNKILKLLKEEGEEYTKNILRILYENLNTDINKTLVSYISGIMKNLKKQQKEALKTEKPAVETREKLERVKIVEETEEAITPEIVEERRDVREDLEEKNTDVSDPISKLLLELYDKMSSEEKSEVREKARKQYLKTTNSKSFNTIHEKIFSTMERIYVLEILRKEKGLA
ncbi:chromosomal replication initiator protein DnaA [Propionigenium maris DSM 9537]|uniref:Chromosomal replication initiator protein DnaA n=1 Tax=Propionigenium maris DSM 9537 TaxID=1123000 RepID=A0A9W6GPR5_9FUSO|nr:hypothetical protein [Propionigenium maris]GLI58195.1 chromosomal replication initiator protein DnaA [Propionigenium maris DSM 9537]